MACYLPIIQESCHVVLENSFLCINLVVRQCTLRVHIYIYTYMFVFPVYSLLQSTRDVKFPLIGCTRDLYSLCVFFLLYGTTMLSEKKQQVWYLVKGSRIFLCTEIQCVLLLYKKHCLCTEGRCSLLPKYCLYFLYGMSVLFVSIDNIAPCSTKGW